MASSNTRHSRQDLDMDEMIALLKSDDNYLNSAYNQQYGLLLSPVSSTAQSQDGPKSRPNKRFLRHLLTDTEGHNVRLLEKEKALAEKKVEEIEERSRGVHEHKKEDLEERQHIRKRSRHQRSKSPTSGLESDVKVSENSKIINRRDKGLSSESGFSVMMETDNRRSRHSTERTGHRSRHDEKDCRRFEYRDRHSEKTSRDTYPSSERDSIDMSKEHKSRHGHKSNKDKYTETVKHHDETKREHSSKRHYKVRTEEPNDLDKSRHREEYKKRRDDSREWSEKSREPRKSHHERCRSKDRRQKSVHEKSDRKHRERSSHMDVERRHSKRSRHRDRSQERKDCGKSNFSSKERSHNFTKYMDLTDNQQFQEPSTIIKGILLFKLFWFQLLTFQAEE